MPTFKKLPVVLSVLSLPLIGCDALSNRHPPLLPLEPVQTMPAAKDSNVYKDLQNTPASEAKRPKSEFFTSSERFVPTTEHATPPMLGGKCGTDAGKGGKSSTSDLQFKEMELAELAEIILKDQLNQHYVMNGKVVGKVALNICGLKKEDLLPALEMVLSMNNAALIKEGNVYRIEPNAEAIYGSQVNTIGRTGYQTRVIPIHNVGVAQLAEMIKPLVHEKTILTVDESRNMLVASGSSDEMSRLMDLIGTFDIDVLKGRSFGLFPLAHAEPETVVDELNEIFNNKKGKDDTSGFFRFIIIERLNAIMAITHQARYLNDIESWVSRLDKANSATGGGVNVYKVQHADAEELAGTLNDIFTGESSSLDKSAKLAPGLKSSSLSNKSTDPSSSSSLDKTSSKSKDKTASRSSRLSSGVGSSTAKVANVDDVRIIADKANNAIVIVATPREYETILPIIKQLDIMPLQVLIDATIVSVNLTDTLKYGIKWFLMHENEGKNILTSNNGSALTAIAEGVATGGFGYSFTSNSGAVRALLDAAATGNNLNVIASPSLMVLNNQEATIEVGDQIPTLASQLGGVGVSTGTGAIGSGNQFVSNSQIDYKDTGTKLEVTPRVNANGMVIMEIKQSDSKAKNDTLTTGINSATISKKEINTFVAVQDGETIVLGGLISDEIQDNKGGIPLLFDLPWIGALFGQTDNHRYKSELVVMITPRVVKSRQDSRQISNEFKRKLTGIYQERPSRLEE